MEIMLIFTGKLQENCYVVYNELTKHCFVIDPGDDFLKIKKEIDSKSLEIDGVLLTHGHYDHIGAAADFQKCGVKIFMSQKDEAKIDSSYAIDGNRHYINKFVVDNYVNDGQIIELCGYKIKVFETPGHSEGSVCYVIDDIIFCGDTLFLESFGRVDFADGSFEKICASIAKLFALEGNYYLYCGHGESSDLDYERKHNPIRNYL